MEQLDVTTHLCFLLSPYSEKFVHYEVNIIHLSNVLIEIICYCVILGQKIGYGHTMLVTPVAVRSLKLSNIGLS